MIIYDSYQFPNSMKVWVFKTWRWQSCLAGWYEVEETRIAGMFVKNKKAILSCHSSPVAYVICLPETNSKFAPENRPKQTPKGRRESIPTIQLFRCENVSFREGFFASSPNPPVAGPIITGASRYDTGASFKVRMILSNSWKSVETPPCHFIWKFGQHFDI